MLAPAVENRCSLNFSPPKKNEHPSTSNILDSTLPRSDSCVTRSRPARIAQILTMTSVALPNVALSRPPTVSLVYSANCSVMKPNRSASGHMANSENVNVHASLHAELVLQSGKRSQQPLEESNARPSLPASRAYALRDDCQGDRQQEQVELAAGEKRPHSLADTWRGFASLPRFGSASVVAS